MPQLLSRAQLSTSKTPNADRAVRIFAKSLFRQLKESGYENREILALSTELVGLITTDLRPAADDEAVVRP